MVEGVGVYLKSDVANARSYVAGITSATVLKTGFARLVRISIVVDDGTPGSVFDCNALSASHTLNDLE